MTMMNKTIFKNIFLHLRTIHIHRKWVRHYCFAIGLYKQGLLHDLSKYSPTEFFESIKYYQGTSSPINASKQANGYSMAWFHHRGRNLHHYENWQDDFDHGCKAVLMPYKYWAEMMCDYLAAGKAYNCSKFTFKQEYEWWMKKKIQCAMHEKNKKMTTYLFQFMAEAEKSTNQESAEKLFTKDILKDIYNKYLEG